MSWLESIVKALNPCIHTWANVEVLKDNPDHPVKVTIIQVCDVCGETRQVNFEGPPPPHSCKEHGHRWETIDTVTLIGDKMAHSGKPSVRGYKLIQRCKECGNTRFELAGLAPKHYPEYGFPFPEGYTPPPPQKCPPHKWKVLHTCEVFRGEERHTNKLPKRIDTTMQCEICGDIKEVKGVEA